MKRLLSHRFALAAVLCVLVAAGAVTAIAATSGGSSGKHAATGASTLASDSATSRTPAGRPLSARPHRAPSAP